MKRVRLFTLITSAPLLLSAAFLIRLAVLRSFDVVEALQAGAWGRAALAGVVVLAELVVARQGWHYGLAELRRDGGE